MPLPAALRPLASAAALRQMLRVAIACAVAYAAYKLIGLKQGYWAVFTVLIVMQGSIGGTLGAALDRLLGTLVGAVLGTVGASLRGADAVQTGAVLVAVTAIGSYVAVLRPRLRVAPVTASIMMLTMPAGTPVADYVLDRIAEIALGGAIGVAAMALVLPARSQALVAQRAAAVLDRMRQLLGDMAERVAGGTPAAFSGPLIALRESLAAVEQALADADREHAARLWRHAIPAAVPRTLWRVRSDLVLVARALDPFPEPVRAALGADAAALLRRAGDLIAACSAALATRTAVARPDLSGEQHAFAAALTAFRASQAGDALTLDAAGHVFGLSFALDELAHDLADLADRIDEMNGAAIGPSAADQGRPAPRLQM